MLGLGVRGCAGTAGPGVECYMCSFHPVRGSVGRTLNPAWCPHRICECIGAVMSERILNLRGYERAGVKGQV